MALITTIGGLIVAMILQVFYNYILSKVCLLYTSDVYKRQDVDYAVIEVGLGGRLDSTNVILPKLSIITNISLDHTQYLGNTLEAIAYEKAGIIKEGVHAVIGNAGGSVREPVSYTHLYVCLEGVRHILVLLVSYAVGDTSLNRRERIEHITLPVSYTHLYTP